MVNITNTAQLDLFSHIRTAILADSVLSAKFKSSDFYELEPPLKSRSVRLPHIVVKIPAVDSTHIVMDQETVMKGFEAEMLMKFDWDISGGDPANSKIRDYCNRIIRAIENYHDTFETNGYVNLTIDLDGADTEVEDMKFIIVCSFTLSVGGAVSR